jgi:hypothetical protein
MPPDPEKSRFEVLRSAVPAERSALDALIDRVTPPSLDPRELLRDHLPLPEELKKVLQRYFEPYGIELIDEKARDLFNPDTERPYTLARGANVRICLLRIPEWILANGNSVGTIDEIRTAFEGQIVRVLAPKLDVPSLALERMFMDW